jgi:hypothetical protein
LEGGRLDDVVVIDALCVSAPRRQNGSGNAVVDRTREEIIARFHAVPRQEVTLPFDARRIAVESVRSKGLRWFRKFDPAVFNGQWIRDVTASGETLDDVFDGIRCRIA